MRVYFNEYNVLMDKAAYLPFVSGILRAYAENSPVLRQHYEFMPFMFMRDTPDRIAAKYESPAVATFSSSMWNEQLNLHVAARVKERFPECLIIFGGAQAPHHPQDYFEQYPFIDVTVRGEGERPFVAILERFLESREFHDIPNVAWRDPVSGSCIRNDNEYPLEKDLDAYPSPYIEGLFDYLFDEHPEIDFQAIIETNRGCPFLCAFCFWGQGGLSLKFRYHSLERVEQEIVWCARRKIRYVFNADSNFGMHRRDLAIAETLVATKTKYGYPEKFRTCFGKNTDERIFTIGELLHKHSMEKGITLSRQSMNAQVLENIDRKNIKMSTYRNLQARFNESEIPVYTELILGLAGETYQSWKDGIEELLTSGLKNQLFVYMCQLFPNTTMASPEHLERFGIRISRIRLTEIHGTVHLDEDVTEYEHLVIGTDALPTEDWRKAAKFSWMTMVLHSLKAGIFVLMYLADRYKVRYTDFIDYISEQRLPDGVGGMLRNEIAEMDIVLDRILEGGSRACALPEFGNIYWDVEEASLFRIARDLDRFYTEMGEVVRAFLNDRNIEFDDAELVEAIRYQRMRVPSWDRTTQTEARFTYNFPEYFHMGMVGSLIPLERTAQTLRIPAPKDFHGDRRDFAREVVLWGRKSDLILEDVEWDSVSVFVRRPAQVDTETAGTAVGGAD
ncbi:MAG: hypothetical protein IID08_03330 [Candidatus Hydrogenedentes bacterium]|nr:hypothetical protein [Candidatus Hydrogenedentota bacterium]